MAAMASASVVPAGRIDRSLMPASMPRMPPDNPMNRLNADDSIYFAPHGSDARPPSHAGRDHPARLLLPRRRVAAPEPASAEPPHPPARGGSRHAVARA